VRDLLKAFASLASAALDHLDPAGHGEHARQAAQCLLGTAGAAQGSDEVDVWMEQWPYLIDVAAFPGLEVSRRDFSEPGSRPGRAAINAWNAIGVTTRAWTPGS